MRGRIVNRKVEAVIFPRALVLVRVYEQFPPRIMQLPATDQCSGHCGGECINASQRLRKRHNDRGIFANDCVASHLYM